MKSFNSQKIMLFDLVHEVPGSLIFGSGFLYFIIEKSSLGLFNSLSKSSPVFNQLRRPITPKSHLAFFILPILELSSNFDNS